MAGRDNGQFREAALTSVQHPGVYFGGKIILPLTPRLSSDPLTYCFYSTYWGFYTLDMLPREVIDDTRVF